MRIAEFSESSNLWTQIALSGYPQEHTSLSVGLTSCHQFIGVRLSEGKEPRASFPLNLSRTTVCVRGKLLSLNCESNPQTLCRVAKRNIWNKDVNWKVLPLSLIGIMDGTSGLEVVTELLWKCSTRMPFLAQLTCLFDLFVMEVAFLRERLCVIYELDLRWSGNTPWI